MVIISNLAVIFKLLGVPGVLGGTLVGLVAAVAIALAWRVHRMDVQPGETLSEKKTATVIGT
jgi:hypothetical protein